MTKKIKLIGIIMLSIYASGFAQVKVENDGSLFVNSSKGNWGRANWTRVHYQNTCAYHLQNMYYNSDVFYVLGSGNVWTRLGYLTSSDEEFKTNIESIPDALTTIKKLRGVTYNRKYTIDSLVQKSNRFGNDSIVQIEMLEPKEYGLIAQEVERIVPEVVHKMQDSSLAISYSSIIPILIEAIKEQQKQIDELQIVIEQNEVRLELQNRNNYNGDFMENESNCRNTNVLFQNNPNPFYESTTIKYFIDNNSKDASLNIYDINGRLIKKTSICDFGQGEIVIGAEELKAGIYVYTLIVDGALVDTKQMILTK